MYKLILCSVCVCVCICVLVCSAAMFSKGGGAQERGGVSVLPRATYTLSPGNGYHGDVHLQKKGNDGLVFR